MIASIEIYWLGRAPYGPTWELQERLRRRVLQGGPEAVLLCEHDPVLTLGRRAQPGEVLVGQEVLRRHGIDLVRTTRGGQVTYHGPGQVVVYPVLRLRRGVLRHVQDLAAAAIDLAATFGVAAAFDREQVGVWAGPRKLAAIGIHVQRGVAIHGLALNLTRQATGPFRQGWFLACGQAGAVATSLAEEAGLPDTDGRLAAQAIAESLGPALCSHFGAPQVPVIATSNEALHSLLASVE